jgi:hypothetical protein
MMAAMGQQDCGQCGYNCEDYANVIFLKRRSGSISVSPAGTPRARSRCFIRRLRPHPRQRTHRHCRGRSRRSRSLAERGRSRDNPVDALFHSRTRLNKPGSGKETWHLELDLAGTGLDYAVGDAFGLYPSNDPTLVDAVIKAIQAPANSSIEGRPLPAVLQESVSLGPAPDTLFQLISYGTGGERLQKAKALASGEDPDGDAATLDVLAAIEKEISRHSARARGVRRGAGSACAAPLFHRFLSQKQSGPGGAHRRRGTLRHQGTPAAWGRLDVSRRARSTRPPGQDLCAEILGFGLPADPAVPIS